MASRSPRLALGTVQFGLAYGLAGNAAPMSDADAREVLVAASAAGIDRLDTAAAYGDIEQRLGRLVGDLPFGVVSEFPALPAGMSAAELARVRNQRDRPFLRSTWQSACRVTVSRRRRARRPNRVSLVEGRERKMRYLSEVICGFSGYDPLEAAAMALSPRPRM